MPSETNIHYILFWAHCSGFDLKFKNIPGFKKQCISYLWRYLKFTFKIFFHNLSCKNILLHLKENDFHHFKGLNKKSRAFYKLNYFNYSYIISYNQDKIYLWNKMKLTLNLLGYILVKIQNENGTFSQSAKEISRISRKYLCSKKSLLF